ncbi:MAG: DUF3787 domain-containing protein [Tissierellia bacterium]|nr:DUF3787 domain-containing protein [Tissierellia bacterium]
MTNKDKILKKTTSLSAKKLKQMGAHLEQEKEIQRDDRPASDVYSKLKGKDPKTGVEVPTDEAVEEAKEWVDQENQR